MLTVCWEGELDHDSPTLGLPVLGTGQVTRLYTASEETGTYSHHSYITWHNGLLVATWSSHLRDEDAPGQRVLMSWSADVGRTWAPWQELFEPHDQVKRRAEHDPDEDRVLIPNGFAVVDGALYAVAEVHVMAGRRGFGRIARRMDDGDTWGPAFWTRTHPPAPRPGFARLMDPSDPAILPVAEAINAWLARPEHMPSWEFLHHTCHPKAGDGHRMCEPTQGWQLADGTWVQLLRDLGVPGPEARASRSFRNYARFSRDDGVTWTPAVRTDVPDAASRSAVCTLPDGTVALINNPGTGRDPLVLSLSADGLRFDRHAVIAQGAPPGRFKGTAKNPGFQYPAAVVVEDQLLVMYSVNKEDVEVMRIPVASLGAI